MKFFFARIFSNGATATKRVSSLKVLSDEKLDFQGVFVSPENTFRKLFYTLVCVCQLRKIQSTENHLRFNRKISHFEHKIIYALILPSNNFRKSHLKRKLEHTPHTVQNPYPSSSQPSSGQPSQALASPDRAAPRSKTHLQAYLQTISRKKKEPNQEQEERVESVRLRTPQPYITPPHPTPARTTTPDRTTASNPRSHRSRRTPAPMRSHP